MADTPYLKQRLPRGDTWILDVEFPNNDLSGWTWACQWRLEPKASAIIATASVDMSQAVNGIVTLTVPAATTATLTPHVTYYFDVQRTASGIVDTVVGGEVTIYWDVTR